MVYKDIFVYTAQYWNFIKGFEIVQEIVDVVRDRIDGYNFNRYSEYGEGGYPGGDPRKHITVRLNLKSRRGTQDVEKKLDEMKIQRRIDDWVIDSPFPSIRSLSTYSSTHHTAHETSTECAFEFYRQMTSSPSEFEKFKGDKVQYLLMFLPLWLKYSGFSLLETVTVTTSSFVDSLARKCAKSFKTTVDKNRIIERDIFAERLIHLFLNCICVPNREQYQIIASIQTMSFFDKLGHSLVDC